MDTKKFQIRSVMLYEYNRGTSASETLKRIHEVFGEESISRPRVFEWFKRFRQGQTDIFDEPRSGRPSLISEDALREAIGSDSLISVTELAEKFNTCKKTIYNTLHRIGFRKKLMKWVPHTSTQRHKDLRVTLSQNHLDRQKREAFLDNVITCDEKWIYYNNATRKFIWYDEEQTEVEIAKRGLTNKKIMLCLWWDKHGVVYHEYLKPNQTIDSDLYCEMLGRLEERMKKTRGNLLRRKTVILHQDNARPHVSKKTKNFIQELGWELMDHPPYSPDLAPSDFYVFRSLQNYLRDAVFNSVEECKNEFNAFLTSRDPQFFDRGYKKWISRWEECVAINGNYILD